MQLTLPERTRTNQWTIVIEIWWVWTELNHAQVHSIVAISNIFRFVMWCNTPKTPSNQTPQSNVSNLIIITHNCSSSRALWQLMNTSGYIIYIQPKKCWANYWHTTYIILYAIFQNQQEWIYSNDIQSLYTITITSFPFEAAVHKDKRNINTIFIRTY